MHLFSSWHQYVIKTHTSHKHMLSGTGGKKRAVTFQVSYLQGNVFLCRNHLHIITICSCCVGAEKM